MPVLALIDILGMSGIGAPPGPSQGPGFPTHPIAPGGQPPGIWGPGSGFPSHPIAPGGPPPTAGQGPGFPTPPIFLPPGAVVPPPQVGIPVFPSQLPMPGGPGGGEGGSPPVAGWTPPGYQPSHPISGGYILVYHPAYGWILVHPGGEGGSGSGEPPKPDQGLPGSQPRPDQGLPEAPPHAQPKK